MQQAWGPWVGTDDARTRLDVGAESHDGFVRIWAQGIVENVYIQTSRVYMHVNINGNDKYGGEQRITGEGQNFTLVTHSLDIPRTHSTQYVKVYATCNYALTGEDSYAETWVAIDPKRSWQVSFDANGGSGAPPQMTKWLGEDMYLPQARPTRDLYDFQGWATSRGGGVTYQPGQQYLPDQDVTLFAVWKLAWAQPTLSGVTATRCDSGGADDEDGTCAKVTARWSVRQSGQSGGTVTVHRRPSAGGDWVQAARQSVSGASGTFSKVVSGFPAGTSWDVRVTFSDGTAEAQALALVPQSFVPLEFSPGGGAASLGAHVPAGAKSGLFVRGEPVVTLDDDRVPKVDAGHGSALVREEIRVSDAVWAERLLGIVSVHINGTAHLPDFWSSYKVGTLPKGWRPSKDVHGSLSVNDKVSTTALHVKPDGAVSVDAYSAGIIVGSRYATGTVTYMAVG